MISECAFGIKSAFDTKNDIGSVVSENDISSFSDTMILYALKPQTIFFMFVTHTACVSTNEDFASQDFSARVLSVNSCTSSLPTFNLG